MKTTILGVIFRAGVSLGLLLATAAVVGGMMVPKEIPKNTETAELLNTVETVPLERHDGGIDFKIDGEVIPYRQLDVIAEIQGRVIYKSENCRLGHSVKAGETLLRIDAVDYQLEKEQLTESIAQAKIDIEENNVQLENTERDLVLAKKKLELQQRDLERNKKLHDSKTVTDAELDDSKIALLNVEDTVQKLENQIRVYKTQNGKLETLLRKEEVLLKTAELNLQRTEIKAPYDGVVTADSFEENTFIQKGASVAKILDTSQLEIQCSLYMKQMQWIQLSGNANDDKNNSQEQNVLQNNSYVFKPIPVTIFYELDGTVWEWDGTLVTLDGGGVNPVTRMVPCRVKVDKPNDVRLAKKEIQTSQELLTLQKPSLFFGMYVTIIVHSKPEITIYRIPEKALLPGNRIWTATGGKLRQHYIRVATTTPDGVLFYADSSLSPTDLVVVSPLASPVEGGSVNVISTEKNVALK